MADLGRRQDHSTLFLEQSEPSALQDLSNSFSKKDNVMIIVTAMKAVREVWIETLGSVANSPSAIRAFWPSKKF